MIFPIVAIAHGGWVGQLINAAQSIAGPQEGIYYVSLAFQDSPELLDEKINKIVDKLGGPGNILFLLDLKGGTPWNAVVKLKQRGKVTCVTGINLPMLLETFLSRESGFGLNKLAQLAAEAGREGITDLDTVLKNFKR